MTPYIQYSTFYEILPYSQTRVFVSALLFKYYAKLPLKTKILKLRSKIKQSSQTEQSHTPVKSEMSQSRNVHSYSNVQIYFVQYTYVLMCSPLLLCIALCICWESCEVCFHYEFLRHMTNISLVMSLFNGIKKYFIRCCYQRVSIHCMTV